jgi:hypothetical protein
MHSTLAVRSPRLFEIEHRSAGLSFFATKRKPRELQFFAGLQHRHGAVGGSEIDSEKDPLSTV